MKRVALGGCLFLMGLFAQEESPMKEKHDWLKQLVGEWTYEADAVAGPDQPPVKLKGTETARLLGDWVLLENRGESPGGAFTGLLTVGYDPARGKYVATFVCSLSHSMVQYEGTLDAEGKALTLETEIPNPTLGGKLSKHRDTIEIQGKDRKTITSTIEMDGKWIPYYTSHYQRKP